MSDAVTKQKVINHLVAGAPMAEAARRAEVPISRIRYWKAEDDEFQTMLADQEERVVNAIIDEGVEHQLAEIKELGPVATQVLKDSLTSHDERLRLQAAQAVLRMAGVGKASATQKPGLEAEIAALGSKSRPQDGD